METSQYYSWGPEAQYGNRTAAVIDITTKSGTQPGFGSAQLFGGSNETVNPSLNMGTAGETVRWYVQNSFTSTNRGLNPPTLGNTIFHDQSNRNQTFFRGDWQVDNGNNVTWLFLNSIAKFQIPTQPGLSPNPTIVGLLQAQDPGFVPIASQDVDEFQKKPISTVISSGGMIRLRTGISVWLDMFGILGRHFRPTH